MANKIDCGTSKILAEVESPVGWITLNDKKRHNAMTTAMWQGLPRAMEALTADETVRVIVLKGAGDRAFVSGADITEFSAHVDAPILAAAYDRVLQQALGALRRCPCPVIAMINGICIGGGLSLALAADIRIASDDARFAIPAARLGLAYPEHLIADLTSVAGLTLAKELLFTARTLAADEALRRGLVNRVVEKHDLETKTQELAGELAQNAPLTLTAAKRAIDYVARGEGDADAVDQAARACAQSQDHLEGLAAFAERRPPIFTGS